MHFVTLLSGALGALSVSASLLPRNPCPPFSGTFSVQNFMLYPENADFDSKHCKFYIGSNFNANVLVYDPYSKHQSIITIPGISGNSSYHISGIDFDVYSGAVYFSANGGEPFVTQGQDLSGPNKIVKYDTTRNQIDFIADLASFQTSVLASTGKMISGFQDMAEDPAGCSFAVASYGSGIARIDPHGEVSTFYVPPAVNGAIYGYSGLAAYRSSLIVSDSSTSQLVKFDTTAKKPTPKIVTLSGVPPNTTFAFDAVYAPPKYNGQVMLCSDDVSFGNVGGIAVFKSSDDWNSAKYLGEVINNDPLAKTGTPTATVQIADSIYIIEEFFFDTGAFDVPGTRSSFPFIDITKKVDDMVHAA